MTISIEGQLYDPIPVDGQSYHYNGERSSYYQSSIDARCQENEDGSFTASIHQGRGDADIELSPTSPYVGKIAVVCGHNDPYTYDPEHIEHWDLECKLSPLAEAMPLFHQMSLKIIAKIFLKDPSVAEDVKSFLFDAEGNPRMPGSDMNGRHALSYAYEYGIGVEADPRMMAYHAILSRDAYAFLDAFKKGRLQDTVQSESAFLDEMKKGDLGLRFATVMGLSEEGFTEEAEAAVMDLPSFGKYQILGEFPSFKYNDNAEELKKTQKKALKLRAEIMLRKYGEGKASEEDKKLAIFDCARYLSYVRNDDEYDLWHTEEIRGNYWQVLDFDECLEIVETEAGDGDEFARRFLPIIKEFSK